MNIPYQGVGALDAAPYIINASRMFIIWLWNVLVWLHHRSVHIPPTNFHAGENYQNSRFWAMPSMPSMMCQMIIGMPKVMKNMDFMLKGSIPQK